jgi:hypothetical protein
MARTCTMYGENLLGKPEPIWKDSLTQHMKAGIEGQKSYPLLGNGIYGHESCGTRNQESSCWRGPATTYWNDLVSQSVAGHYPVEREWPVVNRTLLSSKRRSHFETRRSLQRTKILSWVPTKPVPKTTVLARTSSNLLDWTGSQSWVMGRKSEVRVGGLELHC